MEAYKIGLRKDFLLQANKKQKTLPKILMNNCCIIMINTLLL